MIFKTYLDKFYQVISLQCPLFQSIERFWESIYLRSSVSNAGLNNNSCSTYACNFFLKVSISLVATQVRIPVIACLIIFFIQIKTMKSSQNMTYFLYKVCELNCIMQSHTKISMATLSHDISHSLLSCFL